MNANVYGESYSFLEYLPELSLSERITLVNLCRAIIGQASMDVLTPFGFPIPPNSMRVVKFIHDYVLWDKSDFSTSQQIITIDPATDAQTLSDCSDIAQILTSTGVALYLADNKLKILNEVKPITLDNQQMSFLAILLDSSPQLVTYESIKSQMSIPSSGKDALPVIRRDLFSYLKQVGFSVRAIKHLRSHIETIRNFGYKLK